MHLLRDLVDGCHLGTSYGENDCHFLAQTFISWCALKKKKNEKKTKKKKKIVLWCLCTLINHKN